MNSPCAARGELFDVPPTVDELGSGGSTAGGQCRGPNGIAQEIFLFELIGAGQVACLKKAPVHQIADVLSGCAGSLLHASLFNAFPTTTMVAAMGEFTCAAMFRISTYCSTYNS